MKTTLTFLGGLILLISLGACEAEEMETFDSDLLTSADFKPHSTFNNGMINSYSNETVIEWNEFIARSINQRFPQPAEVRMYAMITLAIHDALNNVVPKYETYALDNSNVDARDISHKNIEFIADAAVAQAARDMLLHLDPSLTDSANEFLNLMLSRIPESALKTRGIEIGKNAAAAVIAMRANDPPLGFTAYSGGTAPGEYQANYPPFVNPSPAWPANAVYGHNLGDFSPFGILSSNQFMDESPYPLNSSQYLEDYNEVKALGCTNCPERTAEQTEIG